MVPKEQDKHGILLPRLGSPLGHVTVEVSGTAAGIGIGLKVSATRLSLDLAPQQTLT
jgi:hypothetical protein